MEGVLAIYIMRVCSNTMGRNRQLHPFSQTSGIHETEEVLQMLLCSLLLLNQLAKGVLLV